MERCAGGILLCAFLAAAQPAPDARRILDQVSAAYSAVSGYELEAAVAQGAHKTTVAIASSGPDRLMLEDKSTGHITSFHDHGVEIFNGRSSGFMGDPPPRPATDDLQRQAAREAARRSAALIKIGFNDYAAIGKGLASARVLRQETLTVDGAAIPCIVVEATYAQKEKRTFWVDADRFAVLRETDLGPAGEQSMEVVKLQWGERPDDSLFIVATHIHRPGVTPPRPIPMQQPRCDLATEEARIARLNGMVSLTFTVDLQGQAKDIQVTGPLGLGVDDPAAECVSQSIYKPAERDGQPFVGTAHVSIGVSTDRSSDWNLSRVEFRTPAGATRPVFLKASYPPFAGAIGHATIHLSLLIDKEGVPQNVEVAGGDPKFEERAVKIARSFRFQPGEDDGHPIEVPANFDLTIGPGVFTPASPKAPACDVATPETQLARLNGKISLSFTADPDGKPVDIRVVQPLGLGADEKAVECFAHSATPMTGKTSAALFVRADPTYSDWNLGRAAFQPPPGATRPVFVKTKWPSPGRHSNGSFRPAIFHLSLTIDKSGTPRNIQVTGADYPPLSKRAASLAGDFRFQPGMLNGQPVDVPATIDLVVNWVLRVNE